MAPATFPTEKGDFSEIYILFGSDMPYEDKSQWLLHVIESLCALLVYCS